jgi:hypothetical protein
MDPSQPTAVDQATHERDRRQETIVEADHVDDTRLLGRVAQQPCLRSRPHEWLLAEDVFARPDRRQARLEVKMVGGAIIQRLDRRVAHQILPAVTSPLEPVAGTRDLCLGRLTPAHAHQPWHGGRGPQHLPHERVGVGVRLSNASRAQESDADLSRAHRSAAATFSMAVTMSSTSDSASSG